MAGIYEKTYLIDGARLEELEKYVTENRRDAADRMADLSDRFGHAVKQAAARIFQGEPVNNQEIAEVLAAFLVASVETNAYTQMAGRLGLFLGGLEEVE